ncbi:MAG: M81 family metallopeptidase [Candidatus Bathyarchaeota archaeon]|nr:M81 family metallopeptidase [Candidatus Bathyarchaeota archaeon]
MAPKRIVLGTFSHETNVLSNIKTDLSEFRKRHLVHGDEIPAHFRGTKTAAGGLIDGCERNGFEFVETVHASATPSGTITEEAYGHILGALLDGIKAAKPFDGVALHLHGAAVAEGHDDVEGDVLGEVRKLIGKKPLVASFDLHANYTEKMVREADILVGYDTYPHIDEYERAVESVDLLAKMMDGKLKPTRALRQPPMLPALQVQFTGRYPMTKLLDEARRMEQIPGVAAVTVAAGFPWSDIKEAGMSFIVITDNDQRLADSLAQELSDLAWGIRRDFLVKPMPVREALRRVKAAKEGPIVLADIGDNPGGGTPCDGTVVLKAVIEEGLTGGVFGVIWDPIAASKAAKAGPGKEIDVSLGGHTDRLHGKPLKLKALVKRVSDGRWIVKGPMGTGSETDMGLTAVLRVAGNDLIITTKRLQPLDLELYRSQGIEPTDARFIVVKSSVHFRASHEPVAKEIIELDTPGLTSPRLAGFKFRKIRRPIFPLDFEMLGITELKRMDEE